MPYILEKKKGAMVLRFSEEAVVDTYQSINLKDFYVNKYFIGRTSISKAELPGIYSELDSLVNEVNLFKKRVPVPNKPFTADKPGKSCLRRSPSSGVICLSYRGKNGDRARTPNTCFLSDDGNSNYSSWACMRAFDKSVSPYSGSNVYSISSSHPEYKKWSDYMDREYERLTGVKVVRSPEKPVVVSSAERDELIDLCQLAYCHISPNDEKKLFTRMAELGICKINDKSTSLYDINGNWICRFDEHKDGDNAEGEMINGVLLCLNKNLLNLAYRVIKSSVTEVDELYGI